MIGGNIRIGFLVGICLTIVNSPFSVQGTLSLPISFAPAKAWRQAPIVTAAALPSIQNYLQDTIARINPAIEELELGSMVPNMPFTDKDVTEVKFLLYSLGSPESDKSDSSDYQELVEEVQVNDVASLNKSAFRKNRPVKILIHGWGMSIKSKDYPGPLKDAYLDAYGENENGPNIVCIEWGSLAREILYFNSVFYAERVGRRVGEFVVFLKLGGFIKDFEGVHIIGFSLGGHVAGVAGHFVSKAMDGVKVGRITGLDPAGPGFSSDTPLSQRLDSTDASFVDVIHTNMGQLIKGEFGSSLMSSHAHFFPNGGHRQPGCELSLLREYSVPRRSGCHHMKSIDYFVKSIQVPYSACKCRDWVTFLAGGCRCSEKENVALMGEHCDPRARGKFYLHAH